MGSYYAEPPINRFPVPYTFPPPDYFSASPKEFRYSSAPQFSPEDIFKTKCYFRPHSYNNPFTSSFPLSYPQPDFTCLTSGEGLYELHGNSPPKANDDSTALANFIDSWLNSDADGNKPTDTASDVCGDSNGKLTTVESMGTAASAHNWNSKEKSSESMAARDTSGEKDTGGGGGAGKNHTCEELSGRGSCGNACYTCEEADHFARKCILGADCGWSGHHTSGNNTVSYVV